MRKAVAVPARGGSGGGGGGASLGRGSSVASALTSSPSAASSSSSPSGGAPRRKGRGGLAAAKSAIAGSGALYRSAYADSKGSIVVTDAETGLPLLLNTKTAYDRAMERGDAERRGGETNSSVGHALAKLCEDPAKSAALHMFVEAQRQALARDVDAEAAAERKRADALREERMVWRKAVVAREQALEREERYRALEKARVGQESALLLKARFLGLL